MKRFLGLLVLVLSFQISAAEGINIFDRLLGDSAEVKVFKGKDKDFYDCDITIKKSANRVEVIAASLDNYGERITSRFQVDGKEHTLYDFFNDAFGVEAESRFNSPRGMKYDTRTSVEFQVLDGQVDRINFVHKLYGTFFFKTAFKLRCDI